MRKPGEYGKVQGCLDALVRALVFSFQSAFAFVALVSLVGIVIQVVDPGGGRSGGARRTVTVWDRLGGGLCYGILAFGCLVVMVKMNATYQRIGPSRTDTDSRVLEPPSNSPSRDL